ncbi:MAG: hypothetical protein H6718_12590 [Polyangiaceae bacterium]|nr:hypothetical protein [Polyangiaceae bacterium]MCB9606909.1 hypothetical protein [Polyangiaceae bacterium]
METTQETKRQLSATMRREYENLQQLRDRIALKAHLGSKDAMQAWDDVERRLETLAGALNSKGGDFKHELLETMRSIERDLMKFVETPG